MSNKQNLINLAVLGVIALSTGACSSYVAKLNKEEAQAKGADEQCYGVAKSGQNDCKTATVVCAGWSHVERDPTAFIYVPRGTCERIVGGSLTPKS